MLQTGRQLFHNEKLRKWGLRLRLPLGVLAAAVLVVFIRPEWFVRGLAVSAMGALAQWWCFGCIKTRKILAVNGPYRYVRNPMYLSRMLLVLGLVLMTAQLWLVVVIAVLYTLYMVTRVEREEAHLAGVFGEVYTDYCRQVPRFIPVFFKVWPGGKTLYFNWEFFQRNHGVVNMLVVVAAYVLLGVITFWGCCGCR